MPASSSSIERAFVNDACIKAAWDAAAALAGQIAQVEAAATSPGDGVTGLVRAFGQAGLLSLVVPAAYGGVFHGVRSVALCLARERLGYMSPLADDALAMQALGSLPITVAGSSTLRREWLPMVARGDVVAALALSEPDGKGELGVIRTTARRDGSEYVLEGEKGFVSNAGIADLYTVFAATETAGKRRRLSAFVVPADTPGLATQDVRVLGGHPTGRVRFRGARVPERARIGAEGEGRSIALGALRCFRPTVGAAAIGFAQRALDETLDHVRARVQLGELPADREAVRMRLANMACEIEASRLLVYRAASAADRGVRRREVRRLGSMAKLVATESAQRVIDQAVELHGVHGIESKTTVAGLYESVRALRVYAGASDAQRLLLARELLRTR